MRRNGKGLRAGRLGALAAVIGMSLTISACASGEGTASDSEPEPTSESACMEAVDYQLITRDWPTEVDSDGITQSAAPPSEHEQAAAALEAYDFSDQGAQVIDRVDRYVETLRAGRIPLELNNAVLAGEIPITSCA